VVRGGRGLYSLPEASVSEHHDMAMLAKRVPHGVICLISALYFHDLGSQLPYETWMAIHPKAHLPRPGHAPFRIVRFSGEALSAGVETHMIEGVPVKVYDVAKTVVDCFKYRHKVGLDVALEALRDFLAQRRGSVDDLWRYAKICRQTNVMRPYLEALTS
jgi:predicted transcriptional regulator of viral defense system